MNRIRPTLCLALALLLPAGTAFAQTDKSERAQQGRRKEA